ncbi:ThuA domain-containing protein [Lentisphaera profundi]|uniref:ThuA domain-containing protein n=1 Tax=Lentisphaera profundi TaxID=1658616 RepID=A0ABY7VWK1_9BACT|nr:ThuA domain-containing protein [Lentisphaera profundi]WDE98616.1 ThuA domain-containing protein [Lentisphaera profundi]
MRLKNFIFSALALASVATFANEDKNAKIKQINQEIQTLQEGSKAKKKPSKATKQKISLLKANKKVIEKEAELNKMFSAFDVVKSKSPRKVLIYSRTTGFRHGSIEMGAVLLQQLGDKTGAYTSVHTEDEAMFNDAELAKYDVILMLSTTRNPIASPKARAAFEKFMASDKGLVGIHAATDCHKDWPNYLEAMGGIFDGHPWGGGDKVTIYNEDPDHVCAKMVPQGFVIQDEIYQYKDDKYFTRDKMRVLLSLDLSGPNMMKNKKKMKRKDNDYAVSWLRSFTGSKVFYTNLGHNDATFMNPVAMQHILTGIQYAAGDIEADATPSAKLGKFPKAVK